MFQISLLDNSAIQSAKKKGFNFAHISMVRIGINPLHRAGLETFAFSALFDQRFGRFSRALIEGIEAPLSNGPIQYDVAPNFSISITGENIMKSLVLGIQTQGYDDFLSNSENLAIFSCVCVRFYNTTIPVVLHAPTKESQVVTLMQYDSSCNPMAPQQIDQRTLCPPSEWMTSWAQRKPQPVSIS